MHPLPLHTGLEKSRKYSARAKSLYRAKGERSLLVRGEPSGHCRTMRRNCCSCTATLLVEAVTQG